jgi:hypothetical protein
MPMEHVRSYSCAIVKEERRGHGGREACCAVFEDIFCAMIKDMHSKEWHLYLAYIHIVESFDVAYRMAHDDVA